MNLLRSLLLSLPILAVNSTTSAAPRFAGVAEGLPAPRAAVLRWDRAVGSSSGGAITYRIYRQERQGAALGKPIATVKGTDWVATGLTPGKPVRFIVRASDKTGEDTNARFVTVTPSREFPKVEWRAVWMTRFEWAGGTRAEISKRLAGAFSAIARGNLNAVIFQVRGQGDTLYPSKDEPWSAALGDDARKGDPVADALRLAHRQGLQFHAWFNLSTIWQSKTKERPKDANHPFYRFADARKSATSRGLIHDEKGKPLQWGADDYVWLTHGNPEVNAYLRKQVTDFLVKYSVDGIHFDDRTGNPQRVSGDPISVQRFSGPGNPDGIKDFGEWQRDQLARLLSDIYVLAKSRNPKLLVTASPFGIADKSRITGYGKFKDAEDFGVDPEGWLRMGIVDALTPQVYWDLPDPEPNYGTLVRDWMRANKTGRPIWPGSALGKFGAVQPLIPVQARYVALTRALGIGGNTFFSWSAATNDQWRAATSIYPAKAGVPIPAHMRPGQTGQVMGSVLDARGKSIVDARIRISGIPRTYLSSADGFFGIPNVSPGNYVISVQALSGKSESRKIVVVADSTQSVEFQLE